MKIDTLETWGIDPTRPLVISGPCSAESEEQMLETARGLKAIGVQIFRAGIWKPRTRPGMFEGIGSQGLKWLKTVKKETGMLTATEVANKEHVYEALKMGVDILWIGARTSANPFAVQEVADALQGADVPVIVKNPVNPDLELWIGAIERIAGAGITKLAAIHRGFSAFDKGKYRNEPRWQVVIELHRRMPELPIICDPSHIGGDSQYIFEISQKAMDLGLCGLIIEAHNNPAEAWSDAKQQITPAQVGEVLQKLVIRQTNSDNVEFKQSLDELRQKIDVLDNDVLNLLQQRMEVVKEIGKNKKENNIQILQSDRWAQIVEKAKKEAAVRGFSEEFVEQFFKAIHQESINIQNNILNA
ncbi:MAG: bifunctional 3-deoxy-7-phosphoheptulonate synthase/chorismate mutase type II [Bacteroidales bacterium]|jgi:chorismate mutase|nr:bifunctional 3-deoxy-7-phosphoheptulonate synthase/chorismate mutase type II [Bacteroidales bacterium]